MGASRGRWAAGGARTSRASVGRERRAKRVFRRGGACLCGRSVRAVPPLPRLTPVRSAMEGTARASAHHEPLPVRAVLMGVCQSPRQSQAVTGRDLGWPWPDPRDIAHPVRVMHRGCLHLCLPLPPPPRSLHVCKRVGRPHQPGRHLCAHLHGPHEVVEGSALHYCAGAVRWGGAGGGPWRGLALWWWWWRWWERGPCPRCGACERCWPR